MKSPCVQTFTLSYGSLVVRGRSFLAQTWGGKVVTASQTLLLTIVLSAIFPAVSDADPVQLSVYKQGQWNAYMVQASDEGIEILIGGGGNATISYPWEGIGSLTFNYEPTPELQEILTERSVAEKALALQPLIEPLFPFARLPDTTTNIHRFIEIYLDSLLRSERIEQAYAAVQTLPLKQLPPTVAAKLYDLTEALFVAGDEESALDLLGQLRANRPADEFTDNALNLAQKLADKQHFSAALGLYRMFLPVADESIQKEIALRCAYLALESNDLQTCEIYRELADDYPGSETDEAIAAIVDGVRAQKTGSFRMALNDLGKGLATIPTDSSWREIAFYYNYLAYREQGDTAIAQSILDEMPLLFPEGAYTAALINQIDP